MNTVVRYFSQALEELHHVRWPTRQQSIRLTVIVIGFIIAMSLAYGVIDFIIGEFLRLTLPV